MSSTISPHTLHFLKTSYEKGKTYWTYYAARRRLGESKPFLWRFGLVWHLFVEGGVFQCRGGFSSLEFRRRQLWALVDSNASEQSVPKELALEGNKLLTIYTSSPQVNGWKGLLQSTSCATVVMNPWSWEEVHQA